MGTGDAGSTHQRLWNRPLLCHVRLNWPGRCRPQLLSVQVKSGLIAWEFKAAQQVRWPLEHPHFHFSCVHGQQKANGRNLPRHDTVPSAAVGECELAGTDSDEPSGTHLAHSLLINDECFCGFSLLVG
jgi:hypothetical protein